MDELTRILIYTAAAGLCIPAGGLLACVEHIQPRWLEWEFRHFVIAFGGGILYLIFQDIAPQSRLDRHWAPPLGAIFGFAVGLTGHALMGG